MTIQLVDSSNLVDFVKTGKVPEFKPPEANAPAAGAKATDASTVDANAKPASEAKAETAARNDKGQFTKQNEGDNNSRTAATAGDDEGGDDLPDGDRVPERYAKQIGKKHRLWKEAEEREQRALRRAQEAERRAAEAERKLRGDDPKSQPVQSQEPQAPKPEDFKSVGEYTAAVVKFELKKREDDERTQREAGRKAEIEQGFVSRVRSAQEKYPDFKDVVGSLSDTDDQVPMAMIEYIQEAELGPDLLYHLAKHPATLDRIRRLSGPRMFAELGKLEDKLGTPAKDPEAKSDPAPAPTKQPERQLSKAPAPIAPLDTAGVAPVAKKPEEMTASELREFRRLEALEKRQHGRA